MTFCIPNAEWLNGRWKGPNNRIVGLAWEEVLEQTCQLGFTVIRLTMQWDQVETSPGHYDYRKIEKALAICAKHKIPVVLCLGAKTPRYPETFIPDFYKQALMAELGATASLHLDQGPGKVLGAFLTESLNRFAKHSSVRAIQVENEPLDPLGDLGLSVPVGLLQQEVAFVHHAAPKQPIVLTMGAGLTDASVSETKRVRFPMLQALVEMKPEQIGFNLYQAGNMNGKDFEASEGQWRVVEDLMRQTRAAGIESIVSELQGEPWEKDPGAVDFVNPNGNRSFTPGDYQALINRTSAMGFKEVWLWGIEFQLACRHQGNNAWLNVTKALLNR